MDEKLCLKWNDFQENVMASFGQMRGDQDFSDVTLACEDQEFEAHKLVLASCSPIFKTILGKTKKHQHPLIYMRGLRARDLEAVVDFIYFGEANIFQADLDNFLAIAEELKLKGLEGNDEKPLGTADTSKMPAIVKPKSETFINSPKNPTENDYESSESYGALVSIESRSTKQSYIDNNTAMVINSMIKKQDNIFQCTECEFKSKYSSHLKEHVQKHIVGLEFPCTYCGKIMRSSAALRKHMAMFHKD